MCASYFRSSLSTLPLFVGVSGCGFVLDVALALALASLIGLPLPAAAAVSFSIVAIFNYILFEFVVFRIPETRAHMARAMGVLSASLIGLGVRLASVAALVSTFGEPDTALWRTLTLAAGACISLAVSFAINSNFVFGGR